MKIAAVCITWNRPQMLGRLIECFNRQTYENRELLILDDGGQYPDQPKGDRWRVVSHDRRYDSLGEKRHAAAQMVEADAMAIWDDDDIYLPHALGATVHGLWYALWVQSREVFEWNGKAMTRLQTSKENCLSYISHHGAWAYRMEAYRAAGGYVKHNEDNDLGCRMLTKFGGSGDTICPLYPEPHYVYSRETDTTHISAKYQAASYEKAWHDMAEKLPVAELKVGWDRDYLAIPRPKVAIPRPW